MPRILKHWCTPPKSGSDTACPKGIREIMEACALPCLKERVNEEVEAAASFLRSQTLHLSTTQLQSISVSLHPCWLLDVDTMQTSNDSVTTSASRPRSVQTTTCAFYSRRAGCISSASANRISQWRARCTFCPSRAASSVTGSASHFDLRAVVARLKFG